MTVEEAVKAIVEAAPKKGKEKSSDGPGSRGGSRKSVDGEKSGGVERKQRSLWAELWSDDDDDDDGDDE